VDKYYTTPTFLSSLHHRKINKCMQYSSSQQEGDAKKISVVTSTTEKRRNCPEGKEI
jgi:hypothetical protein